MKNITKESLRQRTVKQLLQLAKNLNVVGRHDMRKNELIEAIAGKLEETYNVAPVSEIKLDKELKGEFQQKRPREDYIDNIKIGVLVAFKVGNTKALSGMVSEINKIGFVVETKTGVKYQVSKQNIIWVKTGDRWPKGVYLALKGVVNE